MKNLLKEIKLNSGSYEYGLIQALAIFAGIGVCGILFGIINN